MYKSYKTIKTFFLQGKKNIIKNKEKADYNRPQPNLFTID